MNKSESKYFNTARILDEAFLQILENKDFQFVTVKEICKKAGVNRSTFYLHYETMDDLLLEAVEYMNQEFLTYMNSEFTSFIPTIKTAKLEDLYLVTPKYLVPYLSYIKEHKRLFKLVFEKGSTLNVNDTYDKLFDHVLHPILERFEIAKEDQHYLQAFYIQGMMAIINLWLEKDCEDSIDHITSLIMTCVKKSRFSFSILSIVS